MTRRTAPRTVLLAVGELLAWRLGLVLPWLLHFRMVDTLERIAGASVAAVGALPARPGRRAVTWRWPWPSP